MTVEGGLTGQRRFRGGFKTYRLLSTCKPDYLILQVEYTTFRVPVGQRIGKWECRWRDARPEDVQETVVRTGKKWYE